MTAILTHQAILLLARDRLQQLERLLNAKEASGLAVEPIDRQVRYLADQAQRMLSTGPHPQVVFPQRPLTTRLGEGVSKFAVLGSLGPGIVAEAARFAPGQGWAAAILRGGTPDPDRVAAHARSVDFLLELWTRADAKCGGLDADEQKPAREKIRAYVLGYLCRLAGEITAGPWLDDAAAHPYSPLHPVPGPPVSPTPGFAERRALVESALDARVAEQVFASTGTGFGAAWSAWWPAPDEVPWPLYQAFAEAFEAVHLAGERPRGFKSFEDRFTRNDPPPMGPRLVRDGYRAFRARMEQRLDWSPGDWVVALLPAFLPLALAMPFLGLFDNGRWLLAGSPPPEVDADRVWGEALAFPFVITSAVPLLYSIVLTARSSLGVGEETIFALVSGSVSFVMMILFFATLGKDPPGWAQGTFFFGVPWLLEMIFFVWLKARGDSGERYTRLLGMVFLAHAVLSLLATFAYALFGGWMREGPGTFLFWLGLFLWLVLVTAALLLSAHLLRDKALPAPGSDALAGRGRHYLRLLDEASTHLDPAAATPTRKHVFLPAGARRLLRLWWTGANDQYVRPGPDGVELSAAANGAGARLVPSPVAPMTAAEYASVLRRSVAGLQVEVVDEGPLAVYDLPPLLTFATHGDLDPAALTHAQYATAAGAFRKLDKEKKDPGYFLHHAPRHRMAVRYGPAGPAPVDLRRGADPGVGALTIAPAAGVGAGPNDVDASAAAGFLSYFQPGDVIQAGGTRRTVTAVLSDTRLTTVTPLGVGAGTAFTRERQDRTVEFKGPARASVAAGTLTTVNGAGATLFTSLFMPGDVIRVGAEEHVVTAVANDTTLTVDAAFAAAVPASDYYRMPTEAGGGFDFVASLASGLTAGDTVMDQAANLAVLLCLGGASRLVETPFRAPAVAADPNRDHAPAPLKEAVQVFRNWNLDARRLNEWKMLIAGGAGSEKGGDVQADDPMLPPRPAGYAVASTKGEATATSLGWVPLLRKWLDVSRRPGVSSKSTAPLHPEDPSNLALSRAMAFLLDMPDPDPGPP